MFAQLLLLFILIPMADLVLLLMIYKYMTLLPTIALVVVTGVAGAWLARRQWHWLLMTSRSRVSQNQMPSELFSDGAMIMLAGALLITPGIITDMLGISLLIPRCRTWYKARFVHWIKRSFVIQTFESSSEETEIPVGEIVEGHAHKPQPNQPN